VVIPKPAVTGAPVELREPKIVIADMSRLARQIRDQGNTSDIAT
jgi:hypothetical protein